MTSVLEKKESEIRKNEASLISCQRCQYTVRLPLLASFGGYGIWSLTLRGHPKAAK